MQSVNRHSQNANQTKHLGIMKDRATQSPMRKFKVIKPTLNINPSERYFVGFHLNQFVTLLGGARFIWHTF